MNSTAITAGLAAFIALASTAGSAHAWGCPQPAPQDILLPDVPVRDGVSADIHVRVLSNPRPHCKGKTILAVHGATGTASNWEPLAEALFDAPEYRHSVCRIAAVDLPGHGESSLPDGMLFGDLELHDYATAVRETLYRLGDEGVHPRTVMGHSLGGLVVQLLQQQLLDEGSSLREEFDVKHAVLLAPATPAEVPMQFVESGVAAAAVAPFVCVDPALGAHLDVPAPLWPMLVFTTPAGTVVPDAPSTAEIVAQGYVSPEPLAAFSELVGAAPFKRPHVEGGSFSWWHGTKLDVVAFENDALLAPAEGEALYTHLTGANPWWGFTEVPGDGAVHGMLMSNPDGLVDALAGEVALP